MWSVKGIIVPLGFGLLRYRGKLHAVRSLVASCDLVALQKTHGHEEDLGELLKLVPEYWGCGSFAARPNSGGVVVLVRRSLLVAATSAVFSVS